MKIQISDNLIRHYLRNVYFINGHSYAGKSTMVRMLSERYGMIHCGENYHDAFPREKLDRWKQPGLCYFDTMSGWQEWLNQTPEEHFRWTTQVSQECIEVEILELIKRAANGSKVIVDTNIPPDVLREISDYDHVAIMLCDPPDITKEKFFDRDDPDKKFMMDRIMECPDPEATMANFRACLKKINSPEHYAECANAGFFTLVRENADTDTREEVLHQLARHFGLE